MSQVRWWRLVAQALIHVLLSLLLGLCAEAQQQCQVQLPGPQPSFQSFPAIRVEPQGNNYGMMQANALRDAIQRWNLACGNGNNLPMISTGMASPLRVRVIFNQGPYSLDADRHTCAKAGPTLNSNGEIIGGTVRLFETTRAGAECEPDQANLQVLIEHELGHAFGLDESPCPDNVMYGAGTDPDHHVGTMDCDFADIFFYSEMEEEGEMGPGGNPEGEGYNPPSPILIDLLQDGLQLSGLDDSVWFDIDRDGSLERISWTARGSNDAFLALDRNRNGTIDSGAELFGNFTVQPPTSEPNGFIGLAAFDAFPIGDADGLITREDSVFESLLLWLDLDHDGISQADELFRLADSGIDWIDLSFRSSKRRDPHGNWLRWTSRVGFSVRGEPSYRSAPFFAATDVIFLIDEATDLRPRVGGD